MPKFLPFQYKFVVILSSPPLTSQTPHNDSEWPFTFTNITCLTKVAEGKA